MTEQPQEWPPCRYCGGTLRPVGGGFAQCQGCGRQVAARFLA